jgi:TRAP-type C4-dicarboxylate transport system permease small subunit
MTLRNACQKLITTSRSVTRAMAGVTGLLTIVMMLGVVIDAFLRGTAGIAVWGVLELCTLLLLAMIYFGLPSTQSERENFRVSIITDHMPMKLNLFVSGMLLVLQIVILGLLCWFTWRAAIFSFNRDEVSIGLVEISLWPHRFMIAMGLSALTFQSVVSGLDLLLNGKHPFAPDQAIEIAQAVRQQTL